MAELTAEIVRTIVTESSKDLRRDMGHEFANARQEMKQEFAITREEMSEEFAAVRKEMSEELTNVRQEMNAEFATVRREFADGLDQVLTTVQAFHDEDQEILTGLDARLHDHNTRLARLERAEGVRA